MVILYFFVFVNAKLYSDGLLQIFFLAVQAYGWWAWSRAERVDHGVGVGWMTNRSRLGWLAGTIAASALWGVAMARMTDAASPMIDAGVAGFSVAAQILQSLRRVESWMLWILVDVAAIGLFLSRGLDVTAGLYALFLVISGFGLIEWWRKAKA